jgi:hypothetical protein
LVIFALMTGSPIYHPPEPQLEAQSRLISLLSVCEHELESLEALADERLATIIAQMRIFHQELLDALDAVAPESESAG